MDAAEVLGSIRGSIARPVVENEHFAVSPERFYDLSTTEPIIAADRTAQNKSMHGGQKENTQHEKHLPGPAKSPKASGSTTSMPAGQKENTQHEKHLFSGRQEIADAPGVATSMLAQRADLGGASQKKYHRGRRQSVPRKISVHHRRSIYSGPCRGMLVLGEHRCRI